MYSVIKGSNVIITTDYTLYMIMRIAVSSFHQVSNL
jgi:hypothetical protein